MGSVGSNNSNSRSSVNEPESKYSQVLADVENRIRNGAKETAVVMSKSGDVLLEKGGATHSVSFTPSESDLMVGAVVTHNHPSGSSFSDTDLRTLINKNLTEMRAVTKDGKTYSMTDDGTKPQKRVDFARDFEAENQRYIRVVTNPIWAKSEQTAEVAKMLDKRVDDNRREWLRKHAKEYGYDYKEEIK